MMYKAVYIVLNNPGEVDLLYGLLASFDFDGFEERDKELVAYLPGEKLPSEAELRMVLKDFAFRIEEVPDQNWNAVWESHFQPIIIDDFCGIRADFHPPFQHVRHEIIINPRMSFGTGHHATTRMMIRLMREIPVAHKKVLDFGTGTGILSILTQKMGAKMMMAVDNDSNALANAEQNMDENSITGVTLLCQDHPDVKSGKFDIILANITKNTILEAAGALAKQLYPGGLLLLSGFFQEDKQPVEKAFQIYGFSLEKELKEGDWIALQLKSDSN